MGCCCEDDDDDDDDVWECVGKLNDCVDEHVDSALYSLLRDNDDDSDDDEDGVSMLNER